MSAAAHTNTAALTAGGVVSFATWSPTDKSGLITLSNGNKTATAANDGAATFQSGRATRGVQPGAMNFFSMRVTVLPTAAANVALGIASDTVLFSDFLGTGNSMAQYFGDAHMFVLGASMAVAAAWTLSIDVDFAIDHRPGVNLGWGRVNGGPWNAGGAADPATGVGGFDISAITGGQSPAIFYPAFQLMGDAGGLGTVVLNAGASAYPFAAPSGYSNL